MGSNVTSSQFDSLYMLSYTIEGHKDSLRVYVM